jgi:hypothetical protein
VLTILGTIPSLFTYNPHIGRVLQVHDEFDPPHRSQPLIQVPQRTKLRLHLKNLIIRLAIIKRRRSKVLQHYSQPRAFPTRILPFSVVRPPKCWMNSGTRHTIDSLFGMSISSSVCYPWSNTDLINQSINQINRPGTAKTGDLRQRIRPIIVRADLAELVKAVDSSPTGETRLGSNPKVGNTFWTLPAHCKLTDYVGALFSPRDPIYGIVGQCVFACCPKLKVLRVPN